MPQGVADDEIIAQLRGYLRTEGVKSGTVARVLEVERTLIWRVSIGRPISRKNRDLLASRIHRLRLTAQPGSTPSVARSSPIDVQHVVAQAKSLLHMLLEAVEALERQREATGAAD